VASERLIKIQVRTGSGPANSNMPVMFISGKNIIIKHVWNNNELLRNFDPWGRFFSEWFLFTGPTNCGPFCIIAAFFINHFLKIIAIDFFVFHVISLGPPDFKSKVTT